MDKTLSIFRRECHFCIRNFGNCGEGFATNEGHRKHGGGSILMELSLSTSVRKLAKPEGGFIGFCAHARSFLLFRPQMDVSAKNFHKSMNDSKPEKYNFNLNGPAL